MMVCQGPAQDMTCHSQFSPTMTDLGVCHSFNALPFSSLFKESYYTQNFKSVFDPFDLDGEHFLVKNENHGKSFQQYLILDSFNSGKPERLAGSFKISVGDVNNYVSVRDNAIDAETGIYTKIIVHPTQYKADKKIRDFAIEDRQCRYHDENMQADSLFKIYSYETCRFECRLQESKRICGCTPWNYPHYGTETVTEICDGVQAHCFEEMMDKSNLTCDCLPDCTKLEFKTSVTKKKISPEDECNVGVIKIKII
jgi:hypothetical protein